MDTFQTYQKFIRTLFSKDEVIAFAFINPNGGNVEHAFYPESTAETREFFDGLTRLNETYNVYAGMNPFKPELAGQKSGRTKSNVAVEPRTSTL